MNQQYSNTQVYIPGYPHNHQHSAPPSRPQSHGAPQQNLPNAHTLPPLTPGSHDASPFGSEPYTTRTQSLQSSMVTSSHEQVSMAASYPVYGPTANTFYNGQSAAFAQPSTNQQPQQQLHQQSRTSSVNGLSQPVYNSAPGQERLPNLLPMPPRGNERPSLSLGTHMNQLNPAEEPQPTHVVGSQGRRGILPSAAGRPTAVAGANTSGQKAAPTPPKDAEGKYPCPHCNKSYLHAKHLKRHLLRREYPALDCVEIRPNNYLDTGVRPYTCGLCKDTFSRSDILKRHFQKCSVRRGNPSGESHLSHSRANKKPKQEDAAPMESNPTSDISQGQHSQGQQLEVFSPTSLESNFDMNSLSLGQPQYVESANQVSRPSSIKKAKRSTGSHSNRASLGLVNTPGYDPANYGYASGHVTSGHVTPDSSTTSGAATPYNFQYESRSNQISPTGPFQAMNGRDMTFGGVSRAPTSTHYTSGVLPQIAQARGGHELDWPSFPTFNHHDDYANTHYHSGTHTPIHPIKSEGDLASLQLGDYSFLHSKA